MSDSRQEPDLIVRGFDAAVGHPVAQAGARTTGRSLVDVLAVRGALALRAALPLDAEVRAAKRRLDAGLIALAEGHYQYSPLGKIEALTRARGHFAAVAAHFAMAEPLVAEARELTCDIAEALAFPAVRVAAAARADRRAGRIRVLLRVARDAGALTPAACQRHGEAVAAMGAMLGGWQKRIENGVGRAAITASSAVVPGTTTPGTCAPPSATGGRPTTGTTTSVSASSSPPPEPDSAPAGPAEQARSPRRATARRTSSRRSAPGNRRDPSLRPEFPER